MSRRATRFICGLLLAAFCGFPAAAGIVEEIIAQVNDQAIVLSDYQRTLDSIRQDLSQDSKGLELEAKFKEKSKDALRDLIDQKLLVSEAAELGIKVDADVVKRLDSIRVQMKLPSLEALEEAVKKQGMNYEDFKQNLHDNIVTQEVINREVGSKIVVPPAELNAYYEKHKKELERPEGVHIQQILISTDGKPPEEVPDLQKKADEALAAARAGQEFAGLARKYSDDASAANGGDAGFFEKGNMAPEIETVAYSLKKNQVSDVVKTKYGFLIIKLLDHSQAGIPSVADAENTIHEKIYYEKIQPALREYLTKLRQDSFITIKAGYVDTGAAPASPQQASAQKP